MKKYRETKQLVDRILAMKIIKRNIVEVTLLDQGGSTPSASRGNFGLTWVQGKGLGMPRYAEWTLDAVQAWPEFSEELEEYTGISVDFDQPGGFEACLGEEEWSRRKAVVEQMRQESVDGNYDCEMLDRQTMQEMIPKLRLGKTVYGAIGFNMSQHYEKLIKGCPLDIACLVEINEWRGQESILLIVCDIKLSGKSYD